MRVQGYSVFILFLVASTLSLAAQQLAAGNPEPFYFVALTDPACPVSGFTAPAPVTEQIRVLYFPMGQGATIKEPKAPVLHLVFDSGFGQDNDRTVPFTRRDDGVWVATVAPGDRFPRYAIYWIGDRESKHVDTNDDKYFEVPFCDLQGQRDE